MLRRNLTSLLLLLIAFSRFTFAQPASLSGFQDEGTFFLVLNENKLATLRFVWNPDGSFHTWSSLTMAGQTVDEEFQVTPDESGRWARFTMDTPMGQAVAVRSGDMLTRTLKDKSTTVQIKPDSLLFDNKSPALISMAIRRYDAAAGGKQKFPVIVAPGAAIEATLERKDRIEKKANGLDLKLTRYIYGLPGVEISVLADEKGKIYLTDVASQHAYFVREGYDALHVEPVADPLMSSSKYQVSIERDLKVPMRDGLKLVADVYRPAGVTGKLPVILVRTPYKKELNELQGNYYARRGYVYVVQDVRGRFGSPGVWEPFLNEAADGYDSIEWLAAQPWSSGKIGMIGASYLGWVQWWAAAQKPPHLVTIIPNVAPPDPFYNVPYEYGAFFLYGSMFWAQIVQSNATADISGKTLLNTLDKKYTQVLKSLPVIDLDKSVMGKENPYWRRWIQHPSNDDYWARANFLDKLKTVNLPVFHQSGWFDGDGIGTKLNYLRMASHNAPNQKLVVGPWPHSDQSSRFLFGKDFGPDALMDLDRAYVRWFDHWLKGVDNGIEKEPLVSLFAMGSNKWFHGAAYPLPQTKFEKWYLAPEGKLMRETPAADAAPNRYTYDPGDPTPDPRVYEDLNETKEARAAEDLKKQAEAYHDEVLAKRKDILVYTTEPFAKPYTFVGPMSAVLYASSSAKDTDWYVSVYQIDDKGKYFWLCRGVVRARYRNSSDKPELLKPGQIYAYNLDLWHTGITIPAGAKLRIEVASALFPMFSRNLNTGGHNETETAYVSAGQTIYQDAAHPSHILLPMIPEN